MSRSILIGVISLFVFAVFLASCGDLAASNDELSPPLDSFLKATSSGDIDTAWQWVSDHAKQAKTKDSLAKFVSDQPYLFKDYKSFVIKNTNITSMSGQPTVADIAGTISYTDGDTGTFTARLEKQNEGWRVLAINITVSPERIKRLVNGN